MRRYFINEKTARTQSMKSLKLDQQAEVKWLIDYGYKEVTIEEWRAFRRNNPEPLSYVVPLDGETVQALKEWAKTEQQAGRDYTPQRLAAYCVRKYLQYLGRLPH